MKGILKGMDSIGRNVYLLVLLFKQTTLADGEYLWKHEPIHGVSKSTWMTDVYQKIKNRRLGDIIIPGTYASASHHIGNNKELAIEDHRVLKLSQLLNVQKKVKHVLLKINI